MTYTNRNVNALASHYVAEMLTLQADGPFLIGGNCQGATIALAIARTVDLITGGHGDFFQSPSVETLAAALKRRLPGRAAPPDCEAGV